MGLIQAKQLDIEDQHGVRRNDAAGAARAIAQLRLQDQCALAADLHAFDALVPALDHAPRAQGEFERFAAIDRAVEFLAFDPVVIEQPV